MAARKGGRSATAGTAPPRSDVYTGLLLLSLLAMVGGIVLLYMDYSQYPDSKPPSLPQRQAAQPAGGGGGPPGGGGPGVPGGPPGGPPMPPGGMPPGGMPPGGGMPPIPK